MRFLVPDMTCGHCRAAIEQAVHQAGGKADVDLEHHEVEVDGIAPEQAEQAISAAGYTPNRIR